MESDALEKFGLTEGESKVYLALLRIGKSTIGDIIKEAQVSNSKVYDILDRLNKKGLIGVVIESNRKSFEANNPERLKESLQEQEQELEERKKQLKGLLPALKGIYESQEARQEAEILQGYKGIKSFIYRMLEISKKGDVVYVLGAPKEANENINAFLVGWHEERIAKGVICKILYNYNARDWAKQRASMKLTQYRILPKEIENPVAIDIAGDLVGTQVFGSAPLVFVIKNVKVAENYKTYFELLWNISKQ